MNTRKSLRYHRHKQVYNWEFVVVLPVFVLTDTISAIYLLVFPLSSLIRFGLFSLILSNAAGQSNWNICAFIKICILTTIGS